ncbi:CAP domain-containing protein [Sneathiella marina]|uniref:CAP domain-containing protein n=1 Tax=Sneathiella marina TaxID=2950108 RepID=A0ABY4VYV0_9PROT|nr:CAP domain-containing protein [Sneathiella marina]USG60111.1 CAP domain-containing protein [Sneathiella marina]
MTLITTITNTLNTERQKKNLLPLTLDKRLMETAQQHAEFMEKKQALTHSGAKILTLHPALSSPVQASEIADRIRATGYLFSVAAENIALGAVDAAGLIRLWMNSPPHRDNILNTHITNMGIGFSEPGRPETDILRYWSLSLAAPIKTVP